MIVHRTNGEASVLAGVAGAFALAGMASAGFLGVGGDTNVGLTAELVDPAAEGWDVLGYDAGALDTYRVYANFSDDNGVITGIGDVDGVFELNSSDGSFINALFGSDFAPNPAFTGIAPDTLWDTFATIGETVATGPGGVPVTTGDSGFNDGTSGGQAFGLTGNTPLNGTGWLAYGFPDVGNTVGNRVLVFQLTVAEGVLAEGLHWRVSGLNVAGDIDSSFDIISSWAVPSPGAMALLGIAGLISGCRRRRGSPRAPDGRRGLSHAHILATPHPRGSK